MVINAILLRDILLSNNINNAMVTNKKAIKIYSLFEWLFVGTVFVVSMISSHVITELSVIPGTYLPFLQLHITGFQI